MTLTVETPDGPGELIVDEADDPAAVLLLGHGAGGDITGWDLSLLAQRLPALGVSVVRFRQPYRVAGRRVFSSKPGLDRGWAAALGEIHRRWPSVPLIAGGHSAGARTAARGYGPGQQGLVMLSFPLHPPGQPEKSRIDELIDAHAPTLVIQGDRDAFGTPDEISAALTTPARGDVRIVGLEKAGHSLGPTAGVTPDDMAHRERLVIWSVLEFIESTVKPTPAPPESA